MIDTYNDFIKEYIQTGRIPPPLDPSYILKKSPNEINKWFQKIIKKNNISYEDIIAEEGMSLTSL